MDHFESMEHFEVDKGSKDKAWEVPLMGNNWGKDTEGTYKEVASKIVLHYYRVG